MTKRQKLNMIKKIDQIALALGQEFPTVKKELQAVTKSMRYQLQFGDYHSLVNANEIVSFVIKEIRDNPDEIYSESLIAKDFQEKYSKELSKLKQKLSEAKFSISSDEGKKD